MRIMSLSFRNVGPFGTEGVTLTGFVPGLNVICETNEFGKSTLLKSLETVLFKPFSSGDKNIKALRTSGSENGPEGEITFAIGERNFRLTKHFLTNKSARLEDFDSGEVMAVGRSAEEALAKLIRAEHYSGGPSGLLWVRQGTSMESVKDDGQIASRLEGELGTLVGGEKARQYLSRVESELEVVLTKTGKEKRTGPLHEARRRVDATEIELAEAIRIRGLTLATGDALSKVTAEIERADRETQSSNLSEKIKETRREMTSAQSFANALALSEAQYTQAAAAAERAAERQNNHITNILDYHKVQKQLGEFTNAQTKLEQRLQDGQSTRLKLRTEISEIETRLEKISKEQNRREARALQRQRLDILGKDIQTLNAKLVQFDEMDDALKTLTNQISELPNISRDDVETFRRAANELRQCELALAAHSTRLYLALSPKGRGKVTLKGKALESGPFELTGAAALSIEGIGELKSDDNRLRDMAGDRDLAQVAFQGLQVRFGVEDISDAAAIADQRQDIEQARRRIAADMSRLAPEGRSAIATDLSAAQTDAESLSATLEHQDDTSSVIDLTNIHAELRAKRAALDVLEDSLASTRQNLSNAQTEQAQMLERLRGLGLPDDEEGRTKEANMFAREKLEADANLQAFKAELETVKTRAPEHSLDMLTARLTRLEQAAEQSRNGLESLRTRAAALRARRDASFEGGDGDAVVATLDARLEAERTTLAEQIRAKDIRVLLRDTLTATQTRLREAYTAPVTEELAPLLSRVLPGSQAALNDNLGVDTVQRNGKTEAITQLSGGTREQFAILTRLAYAKLLAKSGTSAPVILDDALVYADDARRDAMFDVLGLVSSGANPIQIVYLSCHSGATMNLGGTRIQPKPWPRK